MKRFHELAIALLWAIAIVHTVYLVSDPRTETTLVALFTVCMIGSIMIVYNAKRKMP